ncbi:hypothetical protein [Frankia sp. AgB32]|uniref:hypothetical protein n=1 Tax=Frankia sp. AgB32 TaxID=631119 RepID=UPI00200C6D40|nr:hypothetical protein [Frankia sp. AgB32]MCK9897828.1 hypothetical protein [Frankia sp. AgB32]
MPGADRLVALAQRPEEPVELPQSERLAPRLVQPRESAPDRGAIVRPAGIRGLPGGGPPFRQRHRQQQGPLARGDDSARIEMFAAYVSGRRQALVDRELYRGRRRTPKPFSHPP